jgi:hypothetical protein
MDRLNIQYSGKFYVSGYCGERGYSDAYCFSDIWEKITTKTTFKDRDENFMEVRVIGSDHKDAVLVLYRGVAGSGSQRFHMLIIRDKHSDVILEGNIAHIL